VTDQFGTRTLQRIGKGYLLCTPAMKVPPTTTTTTTTTVTTTTLPCPDDCPDEVLLTLYAGAGAVCATNADCPVGSCDPAINRCRTVTELDLGWTGMGFDQDIDDRVAMTLDIVCPGGGTPGPCGNCTVIGWDCAGGTCRCANDITTACTMPFALDPVCAGNVCNVYPSPPLPLSHEGVASCVISRLAQNVTGMINIDSGATTLDVHLRSDVYVGAVATSPCPHCNDPTPGDGAGDGSCVGGANDTGSCEAGAPNTTFPAPGGDFASLDCPPLPGALVSGAGSQIDLEPLTTLDGSSLGFDVPCSPPLGAFDCACAVCSGDPTIPCNSNATCAAAAAGTCTADGAGAPRQPNACAALTCNPTGVPAHAEDGVCNATPSDEFCNGVLRANGRPFLPCVNNTDCAPYAAGTCSLSESRECFLDPIVVSALVTDPSEPVLTSTLCIPPVANAAINAAAGYAGPGRAVIQAGTSMTCPSDPTVGYTPGAGFGP
jgi:hypothetical protein